MLNNNPNPRLHLAYGPDRHAVETVMRIHSVKRWHMIDTTRQQTLAEHSANVALLAMTIAMNAPIGVFGDPFVVAAAALVHDIPEAFTGDIPTHTKKHLEGLDDLEKAVLHDNFQIRTSANQSTLIKICDIADGIRFIRLHGVDLTARHAREGLEAQFEKRFEAVVGQWTEGTIKIVRNTATFYAYENS